MPAVSGRVVSRNRMGRFIRSCEQAAESTARRLVEEGAQLSREMAPVGSRPDPRTIPLRDSIETEMLSSTSGVWRSTARHALYQEKGTKDFIMVGKPYFKFFWENAGRMWKPGLFGTPDIINHPGVQFPQPFLEPAYKEIMKRAMQVAREEYPG